MKLLRLTLNKQNEKALIQKMNEPMPNLKEIEQFMVRLKESTNNQSIDGMINITIDDFCKLSLVMKYMNKQYQSRQKIIKKLKKKVQELEKKQCDPIDILRIPQSLVAVSKSHTTHIMQEEGVPSCSLDHYYHAQNNFNNNNNNSMECHYQYISNMTPHPIYDNNNNDNYNNNWDNDSIFCFNTMPNFNLDGCDTSNC